jgi:hypothetical protein
MHHLLKKSFFLHRCISVLQDLASCQAGKYKNYNPLLITELCNFLAVLYTRSMEAQDEHLHNDQHTSQPQEPQPIQDALRHGENLSQYTLTVEETSQLFINAGIPRSPRTVIRYCSNKHLDCMKIDTLRNEKYLVSPSSLEARIKELKQVIGSSHVQTSLDTSRHDATYPDMSRHDETDPEETKRNDEYTSTLERRVGELEQQNEELTYKNRDLEITNRVKDMAIKKAESEIKESRGRLMRFNRAIGELATMLRLKAPDQDTSQIIAYIDAPIDESAGQPENFVDTNQP